MIKNIIKKCGDCGKSIVDTEKYDKIAKKYSESIKKSENEKNHLKKTLEDQLKNQKQKQALAINEALKNEKKDREAEITKQVKIKTEKENKRRENENQIKLKKIMKEQKEETIKNVKTDLELQHQKELNKEKIEKHRLQTKVIELHKKIKQGSMEVDGEAQEITLENYLRTRFPNDIITPIGKGKPGADCIHEIIENGKSYGKILWESKNTKQFASDWISKLLTDMGEKNIGFGILASETLPKDFDGSMEFRERGKIMICQFNKRTLDIVSDMIRYLVFNIAKYKNISKNADYNKEELWKVVTSETFRINVINLMNVTKKELEQLEKDQLDAQKSFGKREKIIFERKKYFRSLLSPVIRVEGALPQNLLEDNRKNF